MTRYYHSSKLPSRFFSVPGFNINIFLLTLTALSMFILGSCEEDPTKIGSGLLPGSDFVTIKSTDTLSVWSYTRYDDSIRSDNSSISYLGQIYDPYFGTTAAEVVTQVRLGAPLEAGTYTIDSVKLILRLLDVKGGTGGTHTLSMAEISEIIYTDSVYYSNKEVSLAGFEINDIAIPELKPDSVNNIAITIPDEFGYHLLRDTSKFFYDNPNNDFRSYFKGLYLRISSVTDPVLIGLSLAPPQTYGAYSNYFVLFMHDTSFVQTQYYFILDAMNRNASFNKFSHDFSTALPDKKIENINSPLRDTLSYLQYLNGVYTNIVFPGLKNLKENPPFENIAINKARLIIPVYYDGDLYKASTLPSQLLLMYRTGSGAQYLVPDYNINQTFFDGRPDTTANVYHFNLASFVQGYLKDKTNTIKPELQIVLPTGIAKNVILKANNNKNPVKFEFTYTEF